MKRIVYVAHPLRGDVEENIKKATLICRELAQDRSVIPFSPLHAFDFMDVSGDQNMVMKYCFALLSKVDELWVFGNWRESEGCQQEIEFAEKNSIPIRFMDLGHEN